jgi:polyferredoxin
MRMIFGMTLLTFVHVLLSLIGIGSGFVVLFGLLTSRRLNGWTALFLVTTVLTSVTGFLFPFHRFLPSHGVGVISLIVLAVAIFARYTRQLAGAWRRSYVICAMTALYLNVFVLAVQLFEKVPALKAMAPTQSEPPFKIAQLALLALFIVLTVLSAVKFRDTAVRTA